MFVVCIKVDRLNRCGLIGNYAGFWVVIDVYWPRVHVPFGKRKKSAGSHREMQVEFQNRTVDVCLEVVCRGINCPRRLVRSAIILLTSRYFVVLGNVSVGEPGLAVDLSRRAGIMQAGSDVQRGHYNKEISGRGLIFVVYSILAPPNIFCGYCTVATISK
jgi:hypothetical protein